MNDPRSEELLQRIRAELDLSVESIDQPTRQALARARQRALRAARTPRRSGRHWGSWGWPVAATAGIALAIALSLLLQPVAQSPAPGLAGTELPDPASIADLALLESEESLPMMQDLEFLLWLDDEKLDG